MKDSFVFYRSFYEATLPLNPEQKAQLFDKICLYALNQEETESEPIVCAMFGLIKPQLEANIRRYENGLKGGRPKEITESKPKPNLKITKAKPNANVNDNVNKNVNVNYNEIQLSNFENFWNRYEKKIDQKKCLDKWIRLSEEEKQKALQVVDEYVRSTPEAKFRKNPLTWINGKCWQDDIKAYEISNRDTPSASVQAILMTKMYEENKLKAEEDKIRLAARLQ